MTKRRHEGTQTRRRGGFTALTALMLVASIATIARADELRNVKVGQTVPPFSLKTLDGKTIGSADLAGNAYVLVFLSARQRSSELAATAAHRVYQSLVGEDLKLLFVTADTTRPDYFREQRDRTNVHAPLGLDFNRTLYGSLGLIVLPTTVVIDDSGVLRHVISSYKSDYAHVLGAYARHTLGLIDDTQLQRDLTFERIDHSDLANRVARHRAAARLLRESRLPEDAESELRTALSLDPGNLAARLDLASLQVSLDRIAEARALVDAVLAEEPDSRRGHLLLGVVLYHEDRLDEASELLERVLLLNPDPVYTHYYLGLICERQGNATQAAVHFKEALTRVLTGRAM